MKFFVKIMITVVVLAVLLPFTVLKGKDGKPLMSLSNLKAPDLALPAVPDALKKAGLPKSQGGKDIIYQWKDDQGILHFSSSPPAPGIKFSAKGYDPNVNLIQSVKVEEEKPQPVATTQVPKIEKPSDLVNVYSPEKVGKLIKDAKNVQNLLNERNLKINAMTGSN